MKTLLYIFLAAQVLVGCDLITNESGKPINDNIWVNAYLNAENYNPQTSQVDEGIMTNSDIDWSALTHLTFHSLRVDSTGAPLNDPDEYWNTDFNTDRITSIVTAGHSQNKKILLSVGREDNYDQFSVALNAEHRQQFINTIVDIMTRFEFDGVNLHLVPLLPADYNNFGIFVVELSERLDQITTSQTETPLLTITAMRTPTLITIYSNLQEYLDQINFQTYAMAQPWRGWKAWHSAALHNTDVVFDSAESVPYPSVNSKIHEAIQTGIRRDKIGVGISFNGYIWDYVHFMETWPSWPTENLSLIHTMSYSELASTYDIQSVEWDNKAKAPYLNMINPKAFATFENEESVQEKVNYTKNKRLGGVMIWELSAAFLPNRSADKRDPLLKAIKQRAFITE